MGVTGLWTVVQPCARPIKLETLNKKRLAVDASIWIYQFLKAVRDKEGNALRNSHVVGFFRRICKLLFFGIKPVFVFDGGAPALKRQTIAGRKRRREGRREDAVRTAGKLLAVQMQRRAEEEAERRKEVRGHARREEEEEEVVPEEVVYVEELGMTRDERKRNRGFRKKDAYHLPEMADSLENLGKPDDPRIMSHEELEEYARQFHSGEDINLYDFSKIDFNSPFFLSLPASDRYNILNAARLRSRLRMGYSKDQLEGMFPDRMAFSRFQIERVTERNELTQRLMNINGMNGEDAMNGVGRVAGEKGKEYVLVKNDGVDGGWALGVVTSKEQGERNKPIDVDDLIKQEGVKNEGEDEDSPAEDGGFEDVPIEGLNRLPRLGPRTDGLLPNPSSDEQRRIAKRRQAVYRSRQQNQRPKPRKAAADQDPDSLFIAEERDDESDVQDEEDIDDLFEDVEGFQPRENDADLDRAIAMSLEQQEQKSTNEIRSVTIQDIQQSRADESRPFAKGSGKMIAHIANNRSNAAALKAAQLKADGSRLSPILRNTKVPSLVPQSPFPEAPAKVALDTNGGIAPSEPIENPFGGPLPFEKLDFSKSLLGAKKRKADAANAGGFEKAPDGKPAEKPKPLPPWFASDAAQDSKTQEELEKSLREADKLKEEQRLEEARAKEREDAEMKRILHRHETGDVVEVESSDDGNESDVQMIDVVPVDSELRMGDVADLIRAEPPATQDARAGVTAVAEQNRSGRPASEEPVEWDESDAEEVNGVTKSRSEPTLPAGGEVVTVQETSPDPTFEVIKSVGDPSPPRASISPSPEFEDVEITAKEPSMHEAPKESMSPPKTIIPDLPVDDSFDQAPVDDEVEEYSDPEDEDLVQQLALEAEEHARFAAELNHKSQHQNQEDYERDLRALRNQQKKDRRDADEVSHIMVTECQQLLKLFGLPYITAPMEAEAQCAELVRLGLVDGIVTDDSDCFLFGGTRIYKNMFNQAKFVECYLAGDLEKEFDLDRDKLIRIAHLLGSDYTEGIPSVGPVTALEIVSEFNSEQGLEEFRDWLASVQQGSRPASEDACSAFRKKFRRNATRIFLPPAFPSQAVTQAYLEPEVDSSTDPFQWGIPDLDHLRSYLMATIGWTQERTDEVLVPVIKDMNRRANEGTQSNITGFFSGATGAGAFAPRKKGEVARKGGAKGSTRLEGALGKLREGAKRKRKGSGERGTDDAEGVAPSPVAEERSAPKKAAKRNRRRTKAVEQSSSDEAGHASS